MDNQEKPGTQKKEEKFTIGDRPEAQKALEQFKKTLLEEKSPKKTEDTQKEASRPNSPSGGRHLVAANVTGTKEKGKIIQMEMTQSTGQTRYDVAGSKNFPSQLNRYDKIAEKETDEELKARLSEERAELTEEPKISLSVAEILERSFNNRQKDETAEKEKIKEEKNEIARDLEAALEEKKRVERLKTEEVWWKEEEVKAVKPVDETLALEKKLEEDIKRAAEAVSASKKEGGAGSAELKELESKHFVLLDELRRLRLGKEVKSAGWVAEVKVPENLEKNFVSEKNSEEKVPTIAEKKYIKNMGGEILPEVTAEAQEKIQNLNESLDAQAERIDKEAEDKGYLDVVRTFGRNWKEARLTYKIALPIAVLAGVSSGGIAALLGVSVGIASRIGAGAAVFVGAEAFLEKKRREKERWWNKNPKIMAFVSAGIMSGGIGKAVTGATEASEWLSHTWDNVFGGVEVPISADVEKANIAALSKDAIKPFAMEGFEEQSVPPASEKLVTTSVKEIPVTPPITSEVQTALEQAHETILPPESPLVAEEVVKAASVVAAEGVHAVVSGDNLHNIIGGMKELSELDGGRKENAIANIIEQINKNPAEYGISSDNADKLAVGDSINMEKIHSVLENIKIDGENIVEHAKHLTEKEVFDVDVQRVALSDWREAHPNELFTTETTSEILHGADVVNLSDGDSVGKTSAEITKQFQEVSDIGTTAELPDVAKKYIEDTIGLDNAEWQSLRGTTVGNFLDNFYLDSDSHEAKLKEYLNKVIDDTKVGPNIGETISEYIKRAADYKK